MKESQKLDNLIRKILKEEMSKYEESSSSSATMDEDDVMITPDGTEKTATTSQKAAALKAKPGERIDYRRPGQMEEGDGHEPISVKAKSKLPQPDGNAISEEEKENPELHPTPTSYDLMGKYKEIAEDLEAIKKNPKSPKHARHAENALRHMGRVKNALEALSDHERMMEEKEQQTKQKDAGKHLKAIEKHLGKVIKDPKMVQKMMKKVPIEKAIQLKDKMGGQMDEEKIARALLKHSIKEGVIPVKKN